MNYNLLTTILTIYATMKVNLMVRSGIKPMRRILKTLKKKENINSKENIGHLIMINQVTPSKMKFPVYLKMS